MNSMTWLIILSIAAAGWLLMWFFTRPKGGNGNDDNGRR